MKKNKIQIDEEFKETLLTIVQQLHDQGVDLKLTPPLFRWGYTERPELLFELLISQPLPESDVPFGTETEGSDEDIALILDSDNENEVYSDDKAPTVH